MDLQEDTEVAEAMAEDHQEEVVIQGQTGEETGIESKYYLNPFLFITHLIIALNTSIREETVTNPDQEVAEADMVEEEEEADHHSKEERTEMTASFLKTQLRPRKY